MKPNYVYSLSKYQNINKTASNKQPIIIIFVRVTLIYGDNQYAVADHAALLKIATSA
jgi:hypothetical protein